MGKKTLSVFLLTLVVWGVSLVVPSSAWADEIDDNLEAQEAALTTNVYNKEAADADTFKDMEVNIVTAIDGKEPSLTINPDGTKKIVYSKGLINNLTGYIAMMYGNPPATTEIYIADLLNGAGIGIVQPVYAQGLGFASLNPILNTWKQFRNVAYFFFVVIFLIIGFMIMLRSKVGGQTVVTAQQAIPHIIVALLFVTFSYAIAGLLIDAMYLFMFLMLALFSKDTGPFLDHNFLSLGFQLIKSGFSSSREAVEAFTDSIKLGPDLEVITDFIGGLTLAVIVSIAIALNVFKLFFELLKTYVTIILSIAFAPIILMFGALPGRNTFGGWIKSLVGNLIAFPVVLLALIVFDELTGGISGDGPAAGGEGGFMPPYLLNTGGGFSGALSFMVGLGIILILPDLVKEAKKRAGGGGGIFEQFAGNVGDSLKGGWQGGQLIPGLGPKIGAKGLMKAAGLGASGGLGAGAGAIYGGTKGIAGRRGLRGAAIGALAGGLGAPIAVKSAPGFIKGGIQDATTIARQTLVSNTLSRLVGKDKIETSGDPVTDPPGSTSSSSNGTGRPPDQKNGKI